MYILDIAKVLRKMSVNEIKNFIFEKFYERIKFSKETGYIQ